MLGGMLILAIIGSLVAASYSHLRYRARNDQIHAEMMARQKSAIHRTTSNA
jgi:hypothetical protein